ncbi:hypothetical protein HOY82DRAFT_593060 [Tuber indicum]|nr:hypothetical protein HOY82DRAFT_593060 [Tuber indicum]
MDSGPGHPNAIHSKDSTITAAMMFYPHAPPPPEPGEPTPPSAQNPRDTPSPFIPRVTSPTLKYSAHSDPEPDDLELVHPPPPPYDICAHHSNASPAYCFDCELVHCPGECDGVFGLSKRSGLWLWFVMKWLRRMVGVKSGRVAGEDSAFVQVVGAREAGYRWVGGGEVAWGAVRSKLFTLLPVYGPSVIAHRNPMDIGRMQEQISNSTINQIAISSSATSHKRSKRSTLVIPAAVITLGIPSPTPMINLTPPQNLLKPPPHNRGPISTKQIPK